MNSKNLLTRFLLYTLVVTIWWTVTTENAQAQRVTSATLPSTSYITRSDADAPITEAPYTLAAADTPTLASTDSVDLVKLQADVKKLLDKQAADKEKAEKKAAEDKEKKFTSPDTKLQVRVLFDGTAGSGGGDAVTNRAQDTMGDGTGFRQLRLTWKGSMYDMIEYSFSVDFGGSGYYNFKDCYGGFYNLPCGIGIRAGHFKEPWSMEELSSSADTVMMEKSCLNNFKNIAGGRNNGLMIHNWHDAERISWAVGVFAASMREGLDSGGTALTCFSNGLQKDNYAFTGRLTFLPYYEKWCDGRESFWHIGAAYTYRKFDTSAGRPGIRGTSVSTRPDNALQGNLLNSGTMETMESLNGFQFDTAFVYGSLAIEVEQAFYWLNDSKFKALGIDNPMISSGYVQVSYCLTGEGRNYKKGGGFLGGITPNCPYYNICKEGVHMFSGPGAWEIAYRCSWANIDDLAGAYDSSLDTWDVGYNNALIGHSLTHTIGLNWYLNKNCRLMFDYSFGRADYENSTANNGKHNTASIFGTRFQLIF